MSNFKNRQSAEILKSVYKNADMAYDASGDILKRCRNTQLHREIAAQRERYKNIAAEARGELARRGITPRQSPPHVKAMAKMGIAMKTMTGQSSTRLAKIMIRGTTAGIMDMQHAVNRSRGAEERIKDDAQDLLRREQEYCDSLKSFL